MKKMKNTEISNLKRLTETRKQLKSILNTNSVILHEKKSETYYENFYTIAETKGVKSETLELFSINSKYNLGFAYSNLFSQENGMVLITFKNLSSEKFEFSKLINFLQFKKCFKEFVEELSQIKKSLVEKEVKTILLKIFENTNEINEKELINTLNEELKKEVIPEIKTIEKLIKEYTLKKDKIISSEKNFKELSKKLDKELGIEKLENELKKLKEIKKSKLQDTEELLIKEKNELSLMNVNYDKVKWIVNALIDNICKKYSYKIFSKSIGVLLKNQITEKEKEVK